MTWYAVRTEPGAQMPQREYAAQTTRSRKGYRIVPSLNPRVSAIERSLTDLGISHYMPAEKRLVRDRLKTDLWKVRRFPLLIGYVFVRPPIDWLKLSEAPGVAGIVGCRGTPLAIDLVDILMLRSKEALAEVEFDKQARAAVKALRRKAKTHPELRQFAAMLDLQDSVDIGSIAIPQAVGQAA